ERRGREIVGRQRGEVTRAADSGEPVEQRTAALVVAGSALAIVEARVDGGRRRLLVPVRQAENDPVVLWQLERRQTSAVALAELRPVGEEERHVGAELGREPEQPLARERLVEALIREPECRRRV